MRSLVRSMGEQYHPVDLQSGVLRSAEQVEQGLNKTLAEARQIATEAKLSEASHERLEKAARAVPSLAARVSWWQTQVKALVGGAGLSSPLQQLLLLVLIPACYLMRASDKARNRAMRQALDRTAEALLATCTGQAHPWTLATESERATAMALAWQCADLFQRSSSCVEGRNGYLSLLHHGLRRIPRGRLRALTILHNYFLRRPDGTTAAERFFGHPPADLFEFLLDHVKFPSRPTTRQAAPAADWRAAA